MGMCQPFVTLLTSPVRHYEQLNQITAMGSSYETDIITVQLYIFDLAGTFSIFFRANWVQL